MEVYSLLDRDLPGEEGTEVAINTGEASVAQTLPSEKAVCDQGQTITGHLHWHVNQSLPSMSIQHYPIVLASDSPFVLQSVTREAWQRHNEFESLKQQLSCKNGQELLYDLPSELAGRIIDDSEQVRTKQPPPAITSQREQGLTRGLRPVCVRSRDRGMVL